MRKRCIILFVPIWSLKSHRKSVSRSKQLPRRYSSKLQPVSQRSLQSNAPTSRRPKYYRWPEIGRVVQIATSGESLPIPVRILDHDTSGEFILVSAPGGKGKSALVAESGDKIVLSWVLPNGIAHLETLFLSMDEDHSNTPVLWRLEPISDVVVTERRRYHRAKTRQHLSLHARTGNIPGVLVDISERGMRCLVDTITPGKLTRDELETRVNLSGKPVDIKGLVAWSKHHGGHIEVGITFARLRKQDSEILRSHVRRELAKAG